MIGRNNILNIRYSKRNRWLGQDGQRRGFCNFKSFSYCVRAGLILFCYSYRRQGLDTVEGIINRFAPPSENNTERYISFVCRKSFYNRDEPLNHIFDYCSVLQWMVKFETGFDLGSDKIYEIYKHFNIRFYEKVKS